MDDRHIIARLPLWMSALDTLQGFRADIRYFVELVNRVQSGGEPLTSLELARLDLIAWLLGRAMDELAEP